MTVQLTNQTTKLCVIGNPVAHSKSPLIHNTMLAHLGLDYVYLCQPLAPEDTAQWIRSATLLGYGGFNATMPFKQLLLPHIDHMDPWAERCGAVNTVCIREGKLYGYNTDGTGFLAALLHGGFSPEGQEITVLGAGGAARAVALALVQGGASRVVIANRSLENGAALAALMPNVMSTIPLSEASLKTQLARSQMLVNCTSLGMVGGGGNFKNLDFLQALPCPALVCDLIYNPAETPLLAQAAALGHPVMNGLPLLMHQAILALEQFTQTTIHPNQVLPLLTAALGG